MLLKRLALKYPAYPRKSLIFFLCRKFTYFFINATWFSKSIGNSVFGTRNTFFHNKKRMDIPFLIPPMEYLDSGTTHAFLRSAIILAHPQQNFNCFFKK